jgi:hypothetical protein
VPRFLPDTSCIVPAMLPWHDHHRRAAQAINQRLDRGETLIVAAPTLVEAYSVLTRMPPQRRLSPGTALGLLTANFLGERIETIALTAEAYRSLLLNAPARHRWRSHLRRPHPRVCASRTSGHTADIQRAPLPFACGQLYPGGGPVKSWLTAGGKSRVVRRRVVVLTSSGA